MADIQKPEVKKVRSNYDFILLMLVLLLSVFGLIMIYSVSSYNAAKFNEDSRYYFDRQCKFLVLGLVAMIIVSFIDYRIYIKTIRIIFPIKLVWLLYLLCFALQVLVLFVGVEAGGSSRWLNIPGLGSFQPSELTKICFVLFVAYLIQRISNRMNKLTGFFTVAVYMAPLLALVAKQNLSTAIVLAGMMTVMCFVAARKKGYFLIVFILLVAFAVVFIEIEPYRIERINEWLNPELRDSGDQVVLAMYAIASGGLWGKGLGESYLKLNKISEAHTDMIFSVICEELGIFGAIMVLAVFLMLMWRLLSIALNASDMYGCLIATGVLTHIALQVLLHVAVVTNSIPATGVPLPFISYGGSSLMVTLIEMGIVLSVSKYTDKDKLPDE